MVSPFRCTEASPEGGLILTDDENSRSVVGEILKTLGRKIMEGNFTDIMRISRPASITFPMTYLQAACRDFLFNNYLKEASMTSDPVTRIKLVCAFIVSGLHINPLEFKNKPPFNPILGETHTAELTDGTKIWLEQTCHHPPISSWYMQGPDNLYVFTGHGQIVAGLSGANTIKASKQGKHIIRFRNGDVLEYVAPSMKISGIIFGSRNVNFEGSFELRDVTNGITAKFTFEESKGMLDQLKGKLGGLWKAKPSLPSDFFRIKIVRDDNEEVLGSGTGSWLEYVEFDNQQVWNMAMVPEQQWVVSEDKLPSDSVYRPDLQLLLQGDIENAQIAKDKLENLQRKDKTLRGDKHI